MPWLKVNLPDELDRRFRHMIAKTKGYRKGNIKLSVCEAIELWIEHARKEIVGDGQA